MGCPVYRLIYFLKLSFVWRGKIRNLILENLIKASLKPFVLAIFITKRLLAACKWEMNSSNTWKQKKEMDFKLVMMLIRSFVATQDLLS